MSTSCILDKKKRGENFNYMKKDISIELMKIVCALMVLVYHVINTLVPVETFLMSKQFLVWSFFWGGGPIAVNAFVIISSWYLCNKDFKFSRIVSTWLSTLFYSVLVGVYFLVTAGDIRFFGFHFLPISTNVVWFMRAYILLLLMTPVLNYILEYKRLRGLLIVLLSIFSVYKTIYPGNVLALGDWEGFLLIYLIVGYIKKQHKEKVLKSSTQYLILFLVAYFINILWYVFYYQIVNVIPFIENFGYGRYMFNIYFNNIQCMIGGFSLFGFFKTLQIKYNLVVETIITKIGGDARSICFACHEFSEWKTLVV